MVLHLVLALLFPANPALMGVLYHVGAVRVVVAAAVVWMSSPLLLVLCLFAVVCPVGLSAALSPRHRHDSPHDSLVTVATDAAKHGQGVGRDWLSPCAVSQRPRLRQLRGVTGVVSRAVVCCGARRCVEVDARRVVSTRRGQQWQRQQ